MLAELNPKPDQVTIAINTNQMNVMELITEEDAAGTSMGEPDYKHAYTEMYYEAGPGFVKEHLKRLVGAGIQPHFMIGSIKDLETVERHRPPGPVHGSATSSTGSAIGGGHDGPNPRNLMEFINRVPQNAVLTVEGLMRHVYPLNAMGIAMGLHVRVGQEDKLYGRRGERRRRSSRSRRWSASPTSSGARSRPREQAREIYKIGTFYSSIDETLEKNGWLPNRKPAAAVAGAKPRDQSRAAERPDVSAYAWVVFALTFGLLISDYMARQVLNAVFPLLKAEWALTRRPARFPVGRRRAMVGVADLPDLAARRPVSAACRASRPWRCCGASRPCFAGSPQSYDADARGAASRRGRRGGLRKRRDRGHHQRLSRSGCARR